MGHDIIIFAVVSSDEEHLRMLELEKNWIENQDRHIPKEQKEIPEELDIYYSAQGCYDDWTRLNPNGKRIEFTGDRAYTKQNIILSKLPTGTIEIDIIPSY